MSLSEAQKSQFLDAYTKVLVASWSTEDYAAQLERDPKSALVAAGLHLPAEMQVTVVKHPAPGPESRASDSDMDAQVALYDKSLQTGVLELHIPGAPALETGTVSEADLADVAAGNVYACCCCCCC